MSVFVLKTNGKIDLLLKKQTKKHFRTINGSAPSYSLNFPVGKTTSHDILTRRDSKQQDTL